MQCGYWFCVKTQVVQGNNVQLKTHIKGMESAIKDPKIRCFSTEGNLWIKSSRQSEIQIKMESVSICGSDVHFWASGSLSNWTLDGPLALGHEGSGVVSKVGSGVTNLKVGDRVSIEPATPCLKCRDCKSGRYNLCLEVKGLALPGIDGHITRFFVHAADFCHKIPNCVSFEEGALMEPLSVAVHSSKRGRVKLGDSILICGAGPIGILEMLVCKTLGVVSVCITDFNDKRLDFAKSMGANHVINVNGMDPEQVAKEVELKLGQQADVSMECSGSDDAINTAIYATRPGGVVLLVGMGKVTRTIPLGEAAKKEIDLIGTFRYMDSFPTAISLVASGLVNLKPLITHRFGLLDSVQAFQTARNGEGIKVVIETSKDTV